MDHTPFIIGAYTGAFIILAWCAIAPVIRTRKFRKEWAIRRRIMGATDASDP